MKDFIFVLVIVLVIGHKSGCRLRSNHENLTKKYRLHFKLRSNHSNPGARPGWFKKHFCLNYVNELEGWPRPGPQCNINDRSSYQAKQIPLVLYSQTLGVVNIRAKNYR